MKNRLRDIGEARVAIDAALAGETPFEGALPPSGVGRWLAWGVASAAIVGLAAIAVLYLRESPPPSVAPVRFEITPPENATMYFNLSPDGRKLAFIAGNRRWVHSLESGESRDLTAGDAHVPYWSPDGRFIAYLSNGQLKKIEATGGPPQTLADLPGVWGGCAWNQAGVIVFSAGTLFRVPASGGVPVPITSLDPARKEILHWGPSFLPDGRHFVYNRRSSDRSRSAIYVGSVDATPEQQSSQPVVASDWQASYAPSMDHGGGYLLFVRDGTLLAQPFDSRRMELKGQASVLAERVNDNSVGSAGGHGAFSASANDVLVFQPRATRDRQLTWYDRAAKVLGTVGEPGLYLKVALSPDGSRAALSKGFGLAANIWLQDLSRGATTRFTFGPTTEASFVWSPDGNRIIFNSDRDGPYNLYQKPANGGGSEEALLKSSEDKFPTSWSSDGRFLLYTVGVVNRRKTTTGIWVLPLEDHRKPVPFLITEFNQENARFSPDGRSVAYASDESGHMEVYVRPFSMNSAGTAVETGSKWQISNGIGAEPRWRVDGRELYYRAGGRIMAVDIATSPAFRAGTPQPLGFVVLSSGVSSLAWDSSADGKRFLAPAPEGRKPQPYTVVLNWQADLKK